MYAYIYVYITILQNNKTFIVMATGNDLRCAMKLYAMASYKTFYVLLPPSDH